MTDSVETALRRKKDSSLRVAVSQVKPHADRPSLAQACVSAGNTGALMAVSRYVLKTVDGIDRPAIATVMPNEHDGFTTVLDLGANDDCTGELLLEAASAGFVNFHGNVEATDIFKGTTDIVVCDGFVGNVMLKTAEGL